MSRRTTWSCDVRGGEGQDTRGGQVASHGVDGDGPGGEGEGEEPKEERGSGETDR